MTREHDALRDLIAPVALGAAAPHEIARVEAHAAECAVCREELASLRAAADVLAVAVPQREPSPDLKASIMKVVREEAGERQAAAAAGTEPPEAPAPRPAPRPPPLVRPPGLAGRRDDRQRPRAPRRLGRRDPGRLRRQARGHDPRPPGDARRPRRHRARLY